MYINEIYKIWLFEDNWLGWFLGQISLENSVWLSSPLEPIDFSKTVCLISL